MTAGQRAVKAVLQAMALEQAKPDACMPCAVAAVVAEFAEVSAETGGVGQGPTPSAKLILSMLEVLKNSKSKKANDLRQILSNQLAQQHEHPAGARAMVRWADGIPAEEGLRLVDSIRRSLQIRTRQNIAIAECVIEGRSRQLLTGVSGGASPPGTVPAPTSRLFQTRATRGAIPTDVDSEVKILEDIARDLPRDARGTINLFTERPPCPSCQGVIDQFKKMFPNITVNVTNGGR